MTNLKGASQKRLLHWFTREDMKLFTSWIAANVGSALGVHVLRRSWPRSGQAVDMVLQR